MQRIEPVGPRRDIAPAERVPLLSRVERELERERRDQRRRERERERRHRTEDRSQPAGEGSENGAVEPNSGIDVRA